MSAPVEVRNWVRWRDQRTCAIEGNFGRRVHHIIPEAYIERHQEYFARFDPHQPANLITLCAKHHRIIHNSGFKEVVHGNLIFWRYDWDFELAFRAFVRTKKFGKTHRPPRNGRIDFCYLWLLQGWTHISNLPTMEEADFTKGIRKEIALSVP